MITVWWTDQQHSRFLRARKFVAQDAFQQFKDTEAWRKSNELEALYDKIDTKEYAEARSVVSFISQTCASGLRVDVQPLVSPVDRSTRQARDTSISLRGRKTRCKKDGRIHRIDIEIEEQNVDFPNAPALCPL